MMNTKELNAASFETAVNNSSQPLLVDFWAEWCGPCKMLSPLIDQIADEQAGKAVVAKVNVDEAPDLARQFGIQSIPTLIVFKDGKPVQRLQGVHPKDTIEQALEAAAAPVAV